MSSESTRRRIIICASALLLLTALAAFAADWPVWRGPSGDGTTTETLNTQWPAAGPTTLWKADVGIGHAPVSVAEGGVFTLGYTGKSDTVCCLDATTGEQRWRYDYPAVKELPNEPGGGAYDGPHTAPVVVDGLVYTLSRDGQVHCLEMKTGKLMWQRDLRADLKAVTPECGFSGSPIVADGRVYVNVGQRGTALDAKTGETVWQTGAGMAGYAAIVRTKESLLVFGCDSLMSVDADTGKLVWTCPWATRYGANVADPMPMGDGIFITSAYNMGCAFVDAATGKVKSKNNNLLAHASPVILRDGCIFGFSGYIDMPTADALVCLGEATGDVKWQQKGIGGQMILAGDTLVLLQTNLYCRDPRGSLVCLDVAP
jgi:outer membrane protein assembly factor BamB